MNDRDSLPAFLRGALRSFVSADNRTVRTLRALITRPGSLTHEYMDGHRRYFLSPLEVFLLANLLFFVIGGLTRNPTMTTSLAGQLCCQNHSEYAKAEVGRRVDEIERGSWLDATRDSVTEQSLSPSVGIWTLDPEQVRAYHTKYRLVRQHGVTQFVTRFDMTSSQTARTLVIVLVPLFALVMAVLEIRRGSGVRHLVFALHVYSFTLLVYLVLWIVQVMVLTPLSLPLNDAMSGIFMLGGQTLYIMIALGPAYGDGIVARVVKGAVAGFAAMLILQFYRLLLFLVAFHGS